jgi:DNA-binding NtrC family response regulator
LNAESLIYLVDDGTELLEVTKMFLGPFGYQIKTFQDPAHALAAFVSASPRPGLVITDYLMPRMNGMELIKQMKRMAPQQKTILISGVVDKEIYRDAAFKPDRFLAKPYKINEFLQMVVGALLESKRVNPIPDLGAIISRPGQIQPTQSP